MAPDTSGDKVCHDVYIGDEVIDAINEIVDGHDAKDLLNQSDVWLDYEANHMYLDVTVNMQLLEDYTDYEPPEVEA
jgi:hypothetical protein